jgi:lysylphosphatidylglycerol synthetase-like protein (DUF2156 family)
MRKLLRTFLALIGGVLIVTFAVANRGAVEVSVWPLPFTNSVPLYAILLLGVAIGVGLGGIAAWLSGHSRRVAYRDVRRRVTGLEYREQLRRAAEDEAAAERVRERGAVAIPSPARSG